MLEVVLGSSKSYHFLWSFSSNNLRSLSLWFKSFIKKSVFAHCSRSLVARCPKRRPSAGPDPLVDSCHHTAWLLVEQRQASVHEVRCAHNPREKQQKPHINTKTFTGAQRQHKHCGGPTPTAGQISQHTRTLHETVPKYLQLQFRVPHVSVRNARSSKPPNPTDPFTTPIFHRAFANGFPRLPDSVKNSVRMR